MFDRASRSGFLQLGLKEERRSQTEARQNGSRGPTAKQLELKQLELEQLQLREHLQLGERELEQGNHSHEAKEHKEGREAQPSRERRRSYGSRSSVAKLIEISSVTELML